MKNVIQFLLLVITANVSFAQYTLVKNFNNTNSNTFSYNSYDGFLANLGAQSFIRYDTTNTTTETLLSTITANGHREKIISVPSRSEDTSPTFYDFKTLPNGKMAFIVNAGTSCKIVLTDGTTSGTIIPYTTNSTIEGMELITDGLFFTDRNLSSNNYELMKIDLSTNTVTQVIELGSFYPISDISKTDESTLVFLASDPTDSDNLKLYSSDGTLSGTTAITFIYSGNGVSQQTVMTQVGSNVFFFYKEAGTDCCNYLWVTDGTAGGTTKIKDFNMVSFTDYVRKGEVMVWNGKLYFMAVDSGANYNTDQILWTSDGTLAGTVALNTTSTFSKPRNFTIFNNALYFIAYSSTAYNDRLYITDGTSGGTQSVNVTYNALTLYPYEITAGNNTLYFAAYQNTLGEQLFSYNGIDLECSSALHSSSYSFLNPGDLYINGTALYFTAESTAYGRELFTATTFTTFNGSTGVVNGTNSNVVLFPNPANSSVQVKSDIPVSQISLLTGQGLELTTSSGNFLSLENYAAGMYLIKLTFEDNSTSISKLVVSK